jgi:hypothetical protein
VADPQVYSSAVVSTLMTWPEEVIIAVTEPATGIPSRIAWLPSIAEIVSACKDAYEPIRARYELEKTKRALPAPGSLRLSDAEMAERKAHVDRVLGGMTEKLKWPTGKQQPGWLSASDAAEILARYERAAQQQQRHDEELL